MGLGLDPARRGTIVIGILLIVFGLLALGGQALGVDVVGTGWPLLIIGPGVALFAAAVAIGGPGGVALAIPGAIVTMVGLVLAVQAATGLWATWAYAWALVAPGGIGLGLVAYGLLTGQATLARSGIPVLLTGLGLFFGFGLFFEGVLNLSGGAVSLTEPALAAGLVLLGLLIIGASMLRPRWGP
jgi:hypothetical protein